ncbi:MAG TPA: Asp-tRNA(Asn)/Glu-tRNA(Gln) amidotransferase subunit GatB [Clostridia bacterium]|nr:MAG: Aspartyl/glutamyl-tRNA(Asn/Gln) amidotransferase subunit B [Firmicutes bacterium ADurb.Bin146]HOD93884.1 Asp-tRNA(Asn)/Glu-tRNA(Gln) amidotransferase subunit GatB [Clostridia bacterium]HQM39973.1 Asp-tRNA(Asn)/Glu-tRNA(Gln) amidotransferase subunit GatB [Clostridia bacterium]
MADTYKGYSMNIGLEVHVELKTQSKIFCNCSTTYGAEPNTQVCPVCLGMPGTLPVLNKKAVEYSLMAGLALDCEINMNCKMDRKNYFYPDLPKAYQISQYDIPLCKGGYLDIETDNGSKRVRITRIHLEEDAGKLIHNEEDETLIDCNRCGVPLIEIVTEPDLESANETDVFLNKLRTILLNLGISDCRMNEGSFRADVNLSVRKTEDTELGIRTEMKNLNSFAFIKKAINFEFKRQVDNVLEHKTIEQETRRYDEKSKKTYSMRKKEDADDYRYFPDPDLPRIKLQTDYVENIKKNLPKLATIRKSQIMEKYDLSSYDCEMLLSKPELYDLFEKSALYTTAYKTLSNLIISKKDCILSISAEKIARIADISCQELINISTAKKLIDMLIKEDFDVDETIKKEKMYQINDMDILTCYTRQALLINKKAVESYKKGNLLAVGPIIGHVMKLTNGYGNPETVKNIVTKMLSDIN